MAEITDYRTEGGKGVHTQVSIAASAQGRWCAMQFERWQCAATNVGVKTPDEAKSITAFPSSPRPTADLS